MTSSDDNASGGGHVVARSRVARAGAAGLATASPGSVEPVAGRVLVGVLVFLGLVVAVVSSLGAPLVPTVAVVDGVSLAQAQWSLTVTLLVGAVATPTMGRLGDGAHRRRVMVVAVAVVCVGSVVAALPLGFGFLLVGRALQGVGLGLTPLAIAVARDALPAARVGSAVALLSITTVAGVGLGYPVTGFIAQSWGVGAGFWFGAVLSGVGLVIAVVVLPVSPPRAGRGLDGAGGLLLGVALTVVLLVLSEGGVWGWGSVRVVALVAAAVVVGGGWVRHELRVSAPLIDLRLLRQRAVMTADVVALLSGTGMYLLLASVTRLVQTPPQAGYGFGSSIVMAGLVLAPFSAASLAASRLGPLLARRVSPGAVLPAGCALVLAAMVGFVLARGSLWEVFVIMAVAGLGVGGVFAALPGLVVGAVRAEVTGSAMSVNQVLRYIGYAIGSALSAALLQLHTPAGALLPTAGGYTVVGLLGCALWLFTTAIAITLPPRRQR